MDLALSSIAEYNDETTASDDADAENDAPAALLPQPLLRAVFVWLPVDTRLRCREVCRDWRDALNKRGAWRSLDLSRAAGLGAPVTRALLRAAVARAQCHLACLHVELSSPAMQEALLAAVLDSAATLRVLRLTSAPAAPPRYDALKALLRAAPQLRLLESDLCASADEARRALRNEPPFAPLRVRALAITAGAAAEVVALADALRGHASLRELRVEHARLDTPPALAALADAVVAARLGALELRYCRVGPAAAAALPRLLAGDALRELHVSGNRAPLLDAQAAALLAAALRGNSTLTSLTLAHVDVWSSAAASASLLTALTGHASLARLALIGSDARGSAAAAQLGRLVAADAPALRSLLLACRLGDAGLGPLVLALPRNGHLHDLSVAGCGLSAAFARERLLPAARAAAGLRALLLEPRLLHPAELAFLAKRT